MLQTVDMPTNRNFSIADTAMPVKRSCFDTRELDVCRAINLGFSKDDTGAGPVDDFPDLEASGDTLSDSSGVAERVLFPRKDRSNTFDCANMTDKCLPWSRIERSRTPRRVSFLSQRLPYIHLITSGTGQPTTRAKPRPLSRTKIVEEA